MTNLHIEQRSDMPKGLNGLVVDKNIIINKNLNTVDKGFILAHELAHVFLHSDHGNTLNSDEYSEIERQATQGAIKLLMMLGIDE